MIVVRRSGCAHVVVLWYKKGDSSLSYSTREYNRGGSLVQPMETLDNCTDVNELLSECSGPSMNLYVYVEPTRSSQRIKTRVTASVFQLIFKQAILTNVSWSELPGSIKVH